MLSKSPQQTTITTEGLGEDNNQVFNGLLGLSASEIAGPVEQGMTGDVPNPEAQIPIAAKPTFANSSSAL